MAQGKHLSRKYQCPICRRPQANAQWCADCKAMGKAITRALRDPDPVPEAGAREAIMVARGRTLREGRGGAGTAGGE